MKDSGAVLIVAAMDTKGRETAYIMECLREVDMPFVLIDAGIMGESSFPATIGREEVAQAGGMTLEGVRGLGSEGESLAVMIKGATAHALKLYQQGKIRGIIGLGGSMGSTLGTGVMRAFPIGFPKVMISTMASRDTRPFVGTKDILMLHSVCDLSGINSITEKVLRNGALAVAGMVRDSITFPAPSKPRVLISTLGTTERCMQTMKKALEDEGREVIVFHTVGSGGEAMEELIHEGDVETVIDLSLHELVDHFFGGDYDAGPKRGLAALQKGVPTILVPGNIDFLVAGPLATAKERFPGRTYHVHNAAITTIRTKKREVEFIAERVARYCREAKGPVSVAVPLKGFSAWDVKGGIFYDHAAVDIFVGVTKRELPQGVGLHLLPFHINDAEFAKALVKIRGAMERPGSNRERQ